MFINKVCSFWLSWVLLSLPNTYGQAPGKNQPAIVATMIETPPSWASMLIQVGTYREHRFSTVTDRGAQNPSNVWEKYFQLTLSASTSIYLEIGRDRL